MRYLLSVFLLFNFLHTTAFEVYLVNNRFYAPKIGNYIETEILIPAKGLTFVKNQNNNFQAQVEIILLYKKNNAIVTFDKYLLNSIEIADSSKPNISLIDRKRFTLETGTYTVEAIFTDINSTKEKTINETIIVDYVSDNVFISDIAFIDSYSQSEDNNLYTKSGYQQIPYVLNYFPENVNKLIYYGEVYQLNKLMAADKMATLKYYVKKYNSEETIKDFQRSNKIKANEVNVIFSEFDIANLPSGNYELVIEVRDENEALLAIKKTFFQRSKQAENFTTANFESLNVENSFLNNFSMDEMKYQFRAFSVIATNNEKKTIDQLQKQGNLLLMKQYYLNYWQTQNPENPQAAWQKYMDKIAEVNQSFSSCYGKGYGFETDRGRVYIQYGKPNQILGRNFEAGTYPHEIWHYYTTETGKQNNVRFVFVDKSLSCNAHQLIHSNALGEIYNNQWATLVQKTNVGNSPHETYDMNKVRPKDAAGNRTNTMFKE